MVRFEKNGQENGKTAFLVKKRLLGRGFVVGTIVWDGEWILRNSANGRIERFARLKEAKDEAMRF